MSLPLLPTINASLNGLAGVCLLMGYAAIKRKDRQTHNRWMLAAFTCSALFLCSYIYYHATTHAVTRYGDHGVLTWIYLFILGTHTPLATIIVPFIIMAIRHAIRGELDKHTRITRWLFPAWVYVSVTGVVIYLMLYVFKPA
jgi:putative membrane protein